MKLTEIDSSEEACERMSQRLDPGWSPATIVVAATEAAKLIHALRARVRELEEQLRTSTAEIQVLQVELKVAYAARLSEYAEQAVEIERLTDRVQYLETEIGMSDACAERAAAAAHQLRAENASQAAEIERLKRARVTFDDDFLQQVDTLRAENATLREVVEAVRSYLDSDPEDSPSAEDRLCALLDSLPPSAAKEE